MKMKRASYREAVNWIADHDDYHDVYGMKVIAHVFGLKFDRVWSDVRKRRSLHRESENSPRRSTVLTKNEKAQRAAEECRFCQGTGKIWLLSKSIRCLACNGTGRSPAASQLRIRVGT